MLFMFKSKTRLFTGWPHSQGEKTEHLSGGRRSAEHGWSEEQGCNSCPTSHSSSPLLQAVSHSPPHSQLNVNPFLHACPLFPLLASPIPGANTTASQQWWVGANSGAGPRMQPTALSQGWRRWWLCHHSWPSSQVVASLFYRWDSIFGAIVPDILSRLFASARHNLSGATQPALQNAAWPRSTMPMTLNSLLITLSPPQSWMLTGSKSTVFSRYCSSFPTRWKWWGIFQWVPFHVNRCTRLSGSMGQAVFLFSVKTPKTKNEDPERVRNKRRHCEGRWCREHPLDGSPQAWMGLRWRLALTEKGLVWFAYYSCQQLAHHVSLRPCRAPRARIGRRAAPQILLLESKCKGAS